MVEQGRLRGRQGCSSQVIKCRKTGRGGTSVLVSTIQIYMKDKGSEEASQRLGEVIPGKGNRRCKGRH